MENAKTEGIVTGSTGSWYEVATPAGTLRCRIRGRLRLRGVRSTNPVVVGDRVVCDTEDDLNPAITDILPRRNYVIRRASNL